MTTPATPSIHVGISACLLGQEVRYDGGHKRDPLLIEELGPLFEWVPVCPEVELGLGVPREPLALEGGAAAPRLVLRERRGDITDRMNAWSLRRLGELEDAGLCGYIFKSVSPSCGLLGVPLFEPGGSAGTSPSPAPEGSRLPDRRRPPRLEGVGLFARALQERFPLMPVEDEERLRARERRDAFIGQVLSYWRARPHRRDA